MFQQNTKKDLLTILKYIKNIITAIDLPKKIDVKRKYK